MITDRAPSLATERQDEPKEASYVVTVNAPPTANGKDVKLEEGSEEAFPKTPTITGSIEPLFGKSGSAHLPGSPSSADLLDGRYPEGGIRAWLVVLGCWLALFTSLGFMNVLATFQAYAASNQSIQLSPAAIGGMISGYAFLSFLLGIYVGPLFDKHGPRWLIVSGSLCLVTSLLLASISTEYWHLLAALGILSSLGTSLLFTPAISSIAHFFHHRRGLATGIATTAGSLSGVVFPPLLQDLFARVGWEWAMRVLALLCLALALPAAFLIRARLPPAQDASPHPQSRILRTKGFSLTVLAVALAQLAGFFPLTYVSRYVVGQGSSEVFAASVVIVLNASSAVGRVGAGWAADRVGPFNASGGFAVVAGLACLGVWLPAGGTTAGIVAFAMVIGLASGSVVSLAPVVAGRLCKTQEYGRYFGTCYAVASAVAFGAAKVAVVGRRAWTAF